MTLLKLRVVSPEGYLNARQRPYGELVTQLPDGAIVEALEPTATVRVKVGQQGEWLRVRLPDGREAYLAAWYLQLLSSDAHSCPVWVHNPAAGCLNIRQASSLSAGRITQVLHEEELVALAAEVEVRAKVGRAGEWLHVRLPDGREGYAAANYFSLTAPAAPNPALAPAEEDKITITSALNSLQRKIALTWNRLGGRFQELAAELSINPGSAVAVWQVESCGQPFGPDGRLTVRFENHIFSDYWGKYHPERFAQHFTFNSQRRWLEHRWRRAADQPWQTFHGNQQREWEVLTFARGLDDAAACTSISMGGPQIMGFHYQLLGCASAPEMLALFASGEEHQVRGFFEFIRWQHADQCLRNNDFVGFAGIYNGSGQADNYGRLIEQAYETYRQLRTPAFPFAAPGEFAPAPMVEEDDLQRILGIGPRSAAQLNAEGIYTFAQLAAMEVAYLRELARGRRWLETWLVQARWAAWGDWESLAAFQKTVKESE
ncbi:MAG TPA: DUF3380 domain-containing protein [Thermoflexia bacterium]|nr:DUF3380 domain-containing protein [Thermoflexia bacterium]